MKKLSIVFIALLSLCVVVGCKDTKRVKPKDEVNKNLIQPEMTLRSNDTVQVRRLVRQFFDRLEQKDIDGALAMLHYYKDGAPGDLPSDIEAKERMVYGMFLGMPKYDIDHMIFFREDDSEVKFTVTMFDKVDPKDPRPNKASFLIRPVRYNGQWYLTLADTQTDKVKSEIKH